MHNVQYHSVSVQSNSSKQTWTVINSKLEYSTNSGKNCKHSVIVFKQLLIFCHKRRRAFAKCGLLLMRGLPLLYIQTNLNNSTRQVVGILTFFKYSSASLPLLLYVTFWSTRFLGALPKLNNISQICSASLIPPCLKIPSVLVELD